MSNINVWIDQDLCTGDGICAEICPDIFFMHDDGLAYVKEAGTDAPAEPVHTMTSAVPVSEGHLEDVIDSAEECPGECIFIDVT